MKKVLSAIIFSIVLSGSVYADTCTTKFVGPFTSAQATVLCSKLPTALFSVANKGLNFPAANAETVAAAGTVQGDATSLGNVAWHRVTGADATKGVKLPITSGLAVGMIHYIQNTTAAVLKIWPETGGAINGLSANTNIATVSGVVTVACRVTGTNTWDCA